MKKKRLFGLLLATGFIAGGALVLSSQEENAVVVNAETSPNATFSKIYSDAWNNTTYGGNANCNQILFVFTGTAHGYSADAVITDSSILDNILLNGIALSSFDGALVRAWGNQNFTYIAYPKTAVAGGEGCTLEVKEGFTVGDSVFNQFALRLNANGLWEERSYSNTVNAAYSSIYSDAYNNVEHTTGYNRLMFKYTGTAHGNPATVSGSGLSKYDDLVLIDGQSLSAFAGGATQVYAWSNQLWAMFIYPSSAVSTGSTLIVQEGTKIGDAVFEKIVFRLNSSSKWEKLTLIEDDPLVKNGDYMLFTPSDFGLKLQNDSIPFYGNLNSAFTDSFGFQFNVTVPSSDVATTITQINMGSTDVYGSGHMFRLYLNDGTYRFGVFFNGTFDWTSYNTSPAWDGDVTHIVEFYAIKTDSTHMVLLLGVDGQLIWKTAEKDISAIDFSTHTYLSFKNTGTTQSKNYYASESTLDKALDRFARLKLHSDDIPTSNHGYTGACAGTNGYYAQAKAFYNTYLTDTQKTEFANNAVYADMRTRFAAWANTNGETFDPTSGSFSSLSVLRNVFSNGDKENNIALSLIAAIASLTTITAALVFFKKRSKAK
ncbi:MAG: hypothetical protein IJ247_06430 [Bacilli bacterium]|nr:hypothetical protein [Bacilli bacterium]